MEFACIEVDNCKAATSVLTCAVVSMTTRPKCGTAMAVSVAPGLKIYCHLQGLSFMVYM